MPASFTYPVGVPKTITLRPVVVGTSPLETGAIAPSPIPSWTGFDPTVVSVVPALDGLSATITMLKGNASTVITNSFQNSLNVTVADQVTVNSLPQPATGIEYTSN